ncbi:MAG TPA: CoA activase, partial [Elusimicrobia bacterium]|nr:CoA activase [Elusimicrobiota bacterium]
MLLEKLRNSQVVFRRKTLPPLSSGIFADNLKKTDNNLLNFSNLSEEINAYLGVDVGSISTNLVVIDEQKNLLAKRYLWTAGRPLEAIQKGLSEIDNEVGKKVKICGVCTTGSGRYLTADFLGADIVRNEITAQATAAKEIDPQVDTIFEIGGQDSKFITLKNGVITDFQMNKVCAAGTGSFLEEQAERLGMEIEQEFSQLALAADSPARLGERCTVFMEEDLVNQQQQGVKKEDLVAGLCYSIVENYLNRVVSEKKIGKNIFFQGGVAFNHGVVEAFKKVLKERVGECKFTVPEHHEVTGALGCALIALENACSSTAGHCFSTNFKGFDLAKRKYELKSFVCPDCANHCEIKEVVVEGEKSLFYGSRCEKYEINRFKVKRNIPDLFAEREKLLLSTYHSPLTTYHSPIRIGIPRFFTFYEFYPFFNCFFSELGLQVVLSDSTNRKIINQGLENVPVESCFPHKVSHGHILNLLDKNVDYLFLPSVINFPAIQKSINNSFTCPYVQTLPYVLKVSLEEKIKEKKVKILQPILYFREEKLLFEAMKRIAQQLGFKGKKIKKAFLRGLEIQNTFSQQLKERGREILEQLSENEKIFVIVGRSYNSYDRGMNLEIVKKINNLGILTLPLDFLPLDNVDISEEFPNMYWLFGQRFLAAAEIIKKDRRLYP